MPYTAPQTMPFGATSQKECQQEFKRSGADGKCIEARELIIALPEIYTAYEPQQVLEEFYRGISQTVQCGMCIGSPPQQRKRPIITSTLYSANDGCLPSRISKLPPEAYSTMKQESGYAPRKR